MRLYVAQTRLRTGELWKGEIKERSGLHLGVRMFFPNVVTARQWLRAKWFRSAESGRVYSETMEKSDVEGRFGQHDQGLVSCG